MSIFFKKTIEYFHKRDIIQILYYTSKIDNIKMFGLL